MQLKFCKDVFITKFYIEIFNMRFQNTRIIGDSKENYLNIDI